MPTTALVVPFHNEIAGVDDRFFAVTRYEQNPYFIVLGVDQAGTELGGFSVTEGDLPASAGDVALGKLAATSMSKDVGDTVELQNMLATVQRIGMRSSTLRTVEGAEVIVTRAVPAR